MSVQGRDTRYRIFLSRLLRGCAAAIVIVGAAAFIRLAFMPMLGNRAPYLTFYPAVMLAALYGGLPAGLLGMAISTLLAIYFWIDPPGFSIASHADFLTLTVFITSCTIISIVAEAMHRFRARARAAEEEVRLAVERKRGQDALQESEERLRLFVEYAPAAIGMFDSDMRYIAASRRWIADYGLGNREIIGRSHYEIFPEITEGWKEIHRRCLAGVSEHSDEDMFERADGKVQWIKWEIHPWRTATGKPGGIIIFSEDITARKQAEDELKESEERLNKAQRISRLGSWELNLVNNRLSWSDEVYRIFGFQPQVFGATYEAFLEAVHPDDRAIVDAAYTDSLREGADAYEITHRIVRKPTGEERIVLEKCEHIRDESGRVIRSVGMVHDITERMQAEETLRLYRESLEDLVRERTAELAEQARMTEAFLKLSLAPLVFLDREFNFIRVNEAYAKACGRDVSDFAGHNHFVDYPSAELKEEFEQVVKTKEPFSVIARPFVFPDHPEWGTSYWDLFLYPILGGDGELDFLVFSLNDVTERKLAEEEALRTQKLEGLRVLAGGIAHDLNNMMVAVEANAGLALKVVGDTSPAKDYIVGIEDAADKVSSFSKQILSFAGRTEELKVPVQINDVVKDTGRLLMATISRNAELEFGLTEELPLILASPHNMQQVVMNLIINASDALDGGKGTIRVSTDRFRAGRAYLDTLHPSGLPEGEYVYVEVTDTGCGIGNETRMRIFDPFYSTKFTGRGLGLSAVLGIVSGHGGAVGLISEEGFGATFRMLLPVPERPLVAETVKPADYNVKKGRGTVLIVDDDEDSLLMARKVLENAGYDVLAATDGAEAVETFRVHSGTIAAVLMDIVMPHMRGDQAAAEIRKIRGDTNILLLSGYHEIQLDGLMDGPGRTAVLEKPYRIAKLLGAVSEIVGTA